MGELCVSDFVSAPDQGTKAPMDIVWCSSCTLLQLAHTVDRDKLFLKYWYRSGTNQSMRGSLRDVVEGARARVALDDLDHVVDIGANDGTLLSFFKKVRVYTWAFEPSEAEPTGAHAVIKDYFSAARILESLTAVSKEKAKLIFSVAMFYAVDDPNTFVADIKKVLAPDGLWVIQMNYLPAILKNNAYDYWCHEHLCLYSVTSLDKLLRRHGLAIEDVEFNTRYIKDVNGGSFRAYVRHSSLLTKKPSVARAKEVEHALSLDTEQPYREFAERIKAQAMELFSLIAALASSRKRIYVYGASTKGNTILQWCGLDTRYIQAAVDRNPEKVGLYTVGTGIPIISEEQARADPPEYMLVLPYFFRDEFLERERAMREAGVKFIFPIPKVEVVGG